MSVLLGDGNGSFQTAVNYGPFPVPSTVVVADVNGDGHQDLVVEDYVRGISVLLGNGDGTFQAPINTAVHVTSFTGLAVADFNGDGKLDVANNFLYSGDIGFVAVLLGNGDGTFQAQTNIATNAFIGIHLLAADLNLDQIPDLVTPAIEFGGASVLVGNGDGTFQNVISLTAPGLVHLGATVADLNGDLRPDVVVTSINESLPIGQIDIILHQ